MYRSKINPMDSEDWRPRPMPDRPPPSGIYDEEREERQEEPSLPTSEVVEQLPADDLRALRADARSLGYAIAALTIQVDTNQLEDLVRQLVAEAMKEMEDGIKAAQERSTMDTKEAADYLRTSEQRIYDLVSARKLRPEFKDGKKLIFQRSELEDYLRGEGKRGRRR
jgi:excisionase family DNA binding protein